MKPDMLLQALIRKQTESGLTDRRFAAELGLSRPFWTQIRQGRRRITVAVLRAVLGRFPELEPEVLAFLKGRDGALPSGEKTQVRERR